MGRQRRYSRALLAAVAVTPVAVASLGSPASSALGHARADDQSAGAARVCGNLLSDSEYFSDEATLGAAHACEHLRGRKHAAHLTPADRRTQQRDLHINHDHAEAALETTDPAVIGSWSAPIDPGTKTVGISAVMLHTGKVLLFGGKYKSTDKNTAAFLFDPTTGTGHEVPAPAAVFCGSVTQLSDGRLLTAGGADPVPHGILDLWLFDPVTEQWTKQPDSPLGRYYPTSTKLRDGRILISAGEQVDGTTPNATVELYTPPAPGATVGTLQVVGPSHVTGYYPRQWVMPNGRLLQVDRRTSFALDPVTWTWNPLKSLPGGNGAGSAGLLLPGGPAGSSRVLMIGGLTATGASATTETFDYSQPSVGWSYGTPMPTARAHMNVVQVPDGSAFAVGGNSSTLYEQGQQQTLRYNPTTAAWTPMAVQTPRRAYHSTAVLLPDGRILSAGDGGPGGGRQLVDFYSPPYLFKGPRPSITAAPKRIGYATTFSLSTSGPSVVRAVLMAPGATTHANEMNARHVELSVTSTATGLTATAPKAGVAPPGYYMLFALTADGVPSVARWVRVGP